MVQHYLYRDSNLHAVFTTCTTETSKYSKFMRTDKTDGEIIDIETEFVSKTKWFKIHSWQLLPSIFIACLQQQAKCIRTMRACKCVGCTWLAVAHLRDVNRSLNYSWCKHWTIHITIIWDLLWLFLKPVPELKAHRIRAEQSKANATDNDNRQW